ncbi:MAG: FG-GAP repeat domain-containing protein [Pseudonocardiaceae bacterium]
MTFRLDKMFRTSVVRGSAVTISAFALLCVAAAPAGAASPLTPLPPLLQGPAFSATATSIPVGGAPSAIATGDLNGDGRLDLATANAGTQDISLLLNDGGGHYTHQLLGPTGTNSNAIAIGNLTGDGQGSDVAVTNGRSNTMTLFRRDASSPTGYQHATLPTGPFPHSVTIGDLNSDGRGDLVVTNRHGASVTLFLANANDDGYTTTTLPTPGDALAGSGPVAAVIGDLSGHGPHDIAVADGNSASVTLFFKNTGGDGYTSKTLPAGLGTVSTIAIGDLGGHGPGSDLAVKNVHDNSLTVFLRDPTSVSGFTTKTLALGTTNSSGTKSIVIGDIHGRCLPVGARTRFPGLTLPGLGIGHQAIDSLRHCLPGLAVANRLDQSVIVFTKNETGSDFTRTTVSTGAGPVDLAIGDLTGSGKLDLATVNTFSNDVTLLTNTTQRIRLGG